MQRPKGMEVPVSIRAHERMLHHRALLRRGPVWQRETEREAGFLPEYLEPLYQLGSAGKLKSCATPLSPNPGA
eukprot:1156552-Pelagomonas_calceolata.AAC.2